MKTTVLVILALVIVAAGAVWYMSHNRTQSETPSSLGQMTEESPSPVPNAMDSITASPTAVASPSIMDTSIQEITVEGTEFKFLPATLTFKKGQKVRLTLKNSGTMMHDWVVDELGVRTKRITAGSEDVIEFTPDKAGTFEYYCSVGKHRQMGMVGKLTVTE